MKTIIPHTIIKNDSKLINSLKKDYKIDISGDYAIINSEISAPDNISKESVDAITEEINNSFNKLDSIEEAISSAHVLVRTGARGKMEKGKPTGYIVELTDNGAVAHSLKHMEELPLLGGYGSLLDPVQLACNTEDGDLRNTKDEDLKKRIAKEKDVANKVEYSIVEGINLSFSRAATADRYGPTQSKRNQWSVLNINEDKDARSYLVIFDAANLTENPLEYFARENFDEMEYARRRINPEQIKHIGGVEFNKEKGLWVLDSPLITDVDGKLEMMNSNYNSKISDNYINTITNGLVGAEKICPGFAKEYMKNTIQANKKPLYNHQKFKETLDAKMLK